MARILIVDDESSIRTTLAKFVQAAGHVVQEAESAEGALTLLREQAFDVVVTDIFMPRITGVELLQQLHNSAPHVKVVIMTGDPTIQTVVDSLRAGAFDYLLKPVIKEAIVRVVGQAVHVKTLEDDRQRLEAENLAYQHELERLVHERTGELEASRDQYRQLSEELDQRVRERTEQLATANKELESFSYSVSHDLRSPLRSIDGFLHALAESCGDRLTPKEEGFVRRSMAAAVRMGQIIDDLLVLSRVTRADLVRQKLNLSELAHSIVATLRQTEPERQIECLITDDMCLRGDPRLLRTMLENLLGNAWKYTSKTAAGRIEVGSTQDAEGRQVFFVRDNGAGFDMSLAHKLFTPFSRLHSVAEFPGTGIGLATVKRVIDRHGGRIWAEARVDEGATFYLLFVPGELTMNEASLPLRAVLLVEDNPDDADLALMAFEANEIPNRVVVAHDGVEALDYLWGNGAYAGRSTREVPALVLLDLKLPKMDGFEVLRRMRADPRTAMIPVVVLTSSKEEEDILTAYGAGCNSYIRKPVSFDQFVRAIGHVALYWLSLNEPPFLR